MCDDFGVTKFYHVSVEFKYNPKVGVNLDFMALLMLYQRLTYVVR